MNKIVDMAGVREYGDRLPVELARSTAQGSNRRLVIQAYAEGGLACTQVDLLDLLKWLDESPEFKALMVGKKGDT